MVNDPMSAFLVAAGSGLMGTRGGAGFGRAGLMGLDAMQAAKRMQLLESEDRRRNEDSAAARQMRELQMKQIEAAMKEQQEMNAAWGEIGNQFSNRQQQPSGPRPVAGPLNPDMSPVDAAMLSRNNAQASAAGSQPAFPFTWDEVLAIKAKTKGKIDLTQEYKDSIKTEEVKPGTWQRNARGEMNWVPALDMERGLTGGPGGVEELPGYGQIMRQRELDKQRAGALAGAEMDLVTIVDPRPGPTQGKQITVPRSEAAALSRQANNFQPLPAGVQPPQGAPAAQAAQPPMPQGAPAQSRPMPPQQVAGDRRQLVMDELAAEQARLGELQSTSPANLKLKYGAGFDPAAEQQRTQNNIAALNRELQSMGGQPGMSPPQPGMPPPITPEQVKLDKERNDARLQAQSAFNEAYNNMLKVEHAINKEILPRINSLSTGMIGARMKKVEGSQAYGLASWINNLTGRIFIDTLQMMRDMSKTGGAVGQVAVQEMNTLKAALAPVDQAMNERDLREAVMYAGSEYRKSMERLREAFRQQFGVEPEVWQPKGAQGAAPQTPIQSLVDHYAPKR